MSQQTLDTLREDVKAMVATMKSVTGFKIGDNIKAPIAEMAALVEKGKTDEAMKAGGEALKASRNVLGAFLRYSVLDKSLEDGSTRSSRFAAMIERRRDVEQYDRDLIDRLEKLRKELIEAVHEETNGTFERRVAAYNALDAEIKRIDAEQQRRDMKRGVIADTSRRTRQAKEDAEATERNRAHAATQRELLLAQRKQAADEIRSLIEG